MIWWPAKQAAQPHQSLYCKSTWNVTLHVSFDLMAKQVVQHHQSLHCKSTWNVTLHVSFDVMAKQEAQPLKSIHCKSTCNVTLHVSFGQTSVEWYRSRDVMRLQFKDVVQLFKIKVLQTLFNYIKSQSHRRCSII